MPRAISSFPGLKFLLSSAAFVREGSWLGCRAGKRLPRIRDVGFQEETVTCVSRFSPSPRSGSLPRWRYRVAPGQTRRTFLKGPKAFRCRAWAARPHSRNPLCRMKPFPTAPCKPKTSEPGGRTRAKNIPRIPVASLDFGLGRLGPHVFALHRLRGPQADVPHGIGTDAAEVRCTRISVANKARRTHHGSETLGLVQMDGISCAPRSAAIARQARRTHSLAPHGWGSHSAIRRGILALLIEVVGRKLFNTKRLCHKIRAG